MGGRKGVRMGGRTPSNRCAPNPRWQSRLRRFSFADIYVLSGWVGQIIPPRAG